MTLELKHLLPWIQSDELLTRRISLFFTWTTFKATVSEAKPVPLRRRDPDAAHKMVEKTVKTIIRLFEEALGHVGLLSEMLRNVTPHSSFSSLCGWMSHSAQTPLIRRPEVNKHRGR